MAGLTPIFSNNDIQRHFDKFEDKAEKRILETLVFAGENGVKEARESGKYNDITGNLRSSIGYVVLKDRETVSEGFSAAHTGSDRSTGIQEAKRLVAEVAKSHNKGYVLILVAGMDYALHVESMESKDVLGGTVISTERFLRETLKKVVNG